MDEVGHTTRSVIWTYDLAHLAKLQIPAGAKILSAGWKKPHLRLFVMVDPEVPKVTRQVAVLSTGQELEGEGWEFVGTVIAPLRLVYHVFISAE
jgi:hypothetical protein